MSELNITIDGGTSKRLLTAGKFCDKNILVTATGSSGGGGGAELPEEALVITGNCSYRFANSGWNWFIDEYGDKITTKDINVANNMFHLCSKLEDIPFELNFSKIASYHDMSYIFGSCENLLSIPKFNDCKPNSMSYMFQNCLRLIELPEDIGDWFDWSYTENQTNMYVGSANYLFQHCYSLRKIPMGFLKHKNPYATHSYAYFSGGFTYCASLDELVGLPIPYEKATWTSNAFASTFTDCYRLKNAMFELQEDGTPIVMRWKSQVIDLSSNVGYVTSYPNRITDYNSGITSATKVTNDATYQALKDNPDWWTQDTNYSRYNKQSAVNTINTLPDTSAYLASAGGTNTIKFRGAAGSKTDGGAINTLTAEQIAVATAKGWTVTLV